MSPAQAQEQPRPYLYLYYATMVAVGLVAAILGPALPSLAENTRSSIQAASLLLAFRPLGYMAGTLFAGRHLDRKPAHPMLVGALLATAIAMALTPLAASLAFLLALVLMMGLADGMLDVGCNTLLPWVYGDRVGPYFNGMHFMFGIGALSAPLLVAASLGQSGKASLAFWAIALAILPLALALKRLPSPQKQELPAGDSAPLDFKIAALFVAVFFAYGGSEAAMGGWLFSYASASKLASQQQAAYLTSTFWACLTLGRLAGIALALRLAPQRLLAVDAVGALLSLGLILARQDSAAALWAGTAAAGLMMSSFFPTLIAYASARLARGAKLSGEMVSLFFVGSSSGAIFLPWAIGQGFERLGPVTAMAAVFASLFLMGSALFLLERSKIKGS
jgi:fucose permease